MICIPNDVTPRPARTFSIAPLKVGSKSSSRITVMSAMGEPYPARGLAPTARSQLEHRGALDLPGAHVVERAVRVADARRCRWRRPGRGWRACSTP